MFEQANSERVVITGVGIVAAGCLGVESFWRRLFSGESAVGPATALGTAGRCRVAAEIDSVSHWPLGLPQKQMRYMDTVSVFGLMAAKEVMQTSRLPPPPDDLEADDVGCSIGLSFGSLSANRYESRFNVAMAAVTNYFGSIIGNITIPLRLSGPSHTFMSFDLAGTDAIGYAYQVIRHGKARAMLAGGADSPLSPFVIAQLDRAGFISHGAEEPRPDCRPAGGDGGGVVPGEGAAIVMLESLGSALERGASIYAEVLGYGTAADEHVPAVIAGLLRNAEVSPGAVDCVVAGGTGHAPVDAREQGTLRHVFGERHRPAVTHVSWAVGHSFAAHGAMQAVASTMIVREQAVPPAGRADGSGDDCGLNWVGPPGLSGEIKVLLQHTAGLSGKSSFLLFGKYE